MRLCGRERGFDCDPEAVGMLERTINCLPDRLHRREERPQSMPTDTFAVQADDGFSLSGIGPAPANPATRALTTPAFAHGMTSSELDARPKAFVESAGTVYVPARSVGASPSTPSTSSGSGAG